jgi:hypothetical protein
MISKALRISELVAAFVSNSTTSSFSGETTLAFGAFAFGNGKARYAAMPIQRSEKIFM